MNVDSKGTTDHQRGFELGKLLQVHRNDAFRRGVEVQAESVAEEFGIKSPDACAERNAAEIAFGEEENEAGDRAGLVVLNPFGT